MQTCWRVGRTALLQTSRLRSARWSSTLALDDPERIRNIALLAHIDSGKTTLTESILQATSYLPNAGTVDTGSTTTDFLPAERERGITIQSASIPVRWRDWTFNLIDTPGHVDFGMEVESASRVIDGAVVLMDAVEGVEGQTLGVWRQLDRHSVPSRMVFLNKLDRPGSSVRSSLRSIVTNGLHSSPLLLTLPVASFDGSRYRSGEPGMEGLVDLVNWKVWRWPSHSSSTAVPPVSQPLPLVSPTPDTASPDAFFTPDHPLIPEIFQARESLIDTISLHSPSFMDTFFSLPSSPSPYLSVGAEALKAGLREATLSGAILPVTCGSALRHIGTDVALDFVGDLLASPLDAAQREASDAPAPVHGGNPQLLAWKVGWDKQRGWMTFVRVYSGSITKSSGLFNVTSQQRERPSKLVLLYADRMQSVDELPFGSVGVVMGLKHTKTGDTLLGTAWNDKSTNQTATLGSIVPPPAVISASIIPHSQSDVGPVKEALNALSRTDPSVRISEDEEEGQTLVHGLGALHLEIVEGRLRDEWGVRCRFGKRRVSYRETFGGGESEPIRTVDRWEKEIAGKRYAVEVELQVRPMTEAEIARIDSPPSSPSTSSSNTLESGTSSGANAWGGNIVLNKNRRPLLHPSQLPADSPHMPLSSGIATALSTSPHTSLPISRAHITVLRVEAEEGTPPAGFTGAATNALRHAIVQAGQGNVMEPYVRVKVSVSADYIGRVAGDLTENGGEIMDLDAGEEGAEDALDALKQFEQNGYCPPAWITPSGPGAISSSSSHSNSGDIHSNRSILAVAPLSRMLDYSTRLRALSGGLGVFEMSLEAFRVVPDVRKREILEELGR